MNRFILFAAVVCLMAPLRLAAHATESSFEATVGDLFVDIGYDQPFSLEADTLLDLSLTTLKGEPFPYTSIILTLESGSTIQWKKIVAKPDFGKAVVSALPERSGHWSLRAAFMNESVLVASTVFPVEIAASATTSATASTPHVLGLILTCAALLICAVYFTRKH